MLRRLKGRSSQRLNHESPSGEVGSAERLTNYLYRDRLQAPEKSFATSDIPTDPSVFYIKSIGSSQRSQYQLSYHHECGFRGLLQASMLLQIY